MAVVDRAGADTVRGYAHDLKSFWEFVEARGIAWDRVSLEQLGEFTAWLRQPADNVVVLAGGSAARSAATVNRILTAVFGGDGNSVLVLSDFVANRMARR